jgi:uncharacterized membrane-anchored protein
VGEDRSTLDMSFSPTEYFASFESKDESKAEAESSNPEEREPSVKRQRVDRSTLDMSFSPIEYFASFESKDESKAEAESSNPEEREPSVKRQRVGEGQ